MKRCLIFVLFIALPVFAVAQSNSCKDVRPAKKVLHMKRHIFGPTIHCDDLWQVASLVAKQESVTTHQAAVAIWKKNSRAFRHGNMNGLMSGYELKIPTRDEIKQISFKEAAHNLKQQRWLWVHKTSGKVKTPLKARRSVSPTAEMKKIVPAKKIIKTASVKPHFMPVAKVVIKPVSKKAVKKATQLPPKQHPIVLSNEVLQQQIMMMQKKLDQNEKETQMLNAEVSGMAAKTEQLTQQTQMQEKEISDLQKTTVSHKIVPPSHLRIGERYDINKIRSEFEAEHGLYYVVGFLLLVLLWAFWRRMKRLMQKEVSQNVSTNQRKTSKKQKTNYKAMSGENVMATKLDLAKAYIDMKDVVSAKSVLKDVLKEGNASEKTQANQLLKSITEVKK